jgi:hypothetical protein
MLTSVPAFPQEADLAMCAFEKSTQCQDITRRHRATAVVRSNTASTEATARRTCERSHRSRITVQSPAGTALLVWKKRVATRESSVF